MKVQKGNLNNSLNFPTFKLFAKFLIPFSVKFLYVPRQYFIFHFRKSVIVNSCIWTTIKYVTINVG